MYRDEMFKKICALPISDFFFVVFIHNVLYCGWWCIFASALLLESIVSVYTLFQFYINQALAYEVTVTPLISLGGK